MWSGASLTSATFPSSLFSLQMCFQKTSLEDGSTQDKALDSTGLKMVGSAT